jgi:hypothetical protein
MEILETVVINYRQITAGDSWEIGVKTILKVKEIIRIENTDYLCITVNDKPLIVKGRNKETGEPTYELEQNRMFILAEQFILENDKLFQG